VILDILIGEREAAVPALTIIDVGAMAEGEPRYAPLLQRCSATLIGFEPQPAELEKLRSRAPAGRTYLPHFLGRGGPATFHATRYPGCSSLYEPDPGLIDMFSTIGAGSPAGNFHVVSTSEVHTTRLDDVPGCARPDLIKLDVQGAELDVLEGGVATMAGALVAEVEVEFVPLYRGQPLYGEIQIFFRKHGFQFHKFIDVGGRGFAPLTATGNPFLPISQLLWADAVFVRDFADLGRYADDDLLKAALILDEVYRSYDLVARLLLEYDRRRRSGLAGRYMAELARAERRTLVLNLRQAP